MLNKTQRQAQIVAELHANPMVRIAELARAFEVTTETIRRDISALQDRQLVNRVHGGATAGALLRRDLGDGSSGAVNGNVGYGPLAELALAYVKDGDTVMLEASDLAAVVARQLAIERNDLLVITNGTLAAQHLARNSTHRVQLTPGTFALAQRAAYGTDTLAYVQKHTVSVAIVKADGLTREGAQADHADIGSVRSGMLARARQRVVMVSAETCGRTGFQTFAPLTSIDTVLADATPPDSLVHALRYQGVELTHLKPAGNGGPRRNDLERYAHLSRING